MTKPHEETWVACGGHRVETPDGKVEPTVNPPEREPAICALISQAPAMARLLLRLEWSTFYTDSCNGPSGLRCAGHCPECDVERGADAQHKPDCELASVLRAAGVLL